MAGVRRLLAGALVLVAGLSLTCCQSPHPSAAELAVANPDSLTAAEYVAIRQTDLPSGYSPRPVAANSTTLDEAQTLAEYACEYIHPPATKALVTASTPDFTNPNGTTVLHETTAIFPSPAAATAHLALESNHRYPSCKAAAFRKSLVESAPDGEHIGTVAVHLNALAPNVHDNGLDVVGISTLGLAGGESAVATADLVVLVRGNLVVELSVDTDGPDPLALTNRLTADLAGRLAQIVPHP